jgi:hypothetical protein
MLGASLLSGILRGRATFLGLVAALTVGVISIVLAVPIRGTVRRSENHQLASATLLGFLGAPVEWAAGVDATSITTAALARGLVYACCALSVRAAFARSRRVRSQRVKQLHAASVGFALIGAVAFTLSGRTPEAVACAASAAGLALVAAFRPTAKALRPLGIALALLIIVCVLILV